MKKYTVGFIGAGNMGGVFAEAVSKKCGSSSVAVACSTELSTKLAAEKHGCTPSNAQEIATECRFIFLGIKPQIANDVLSGLKSALSTQKDSIIVSMLAGVTLSSLCEMCGNNKIIRIMPNTPCSVGEGMTQVCRTDSITDEELSEFCGLVSATGRLDIVDEKYIDAACAVSGCGPAYAYIFIEALADGAVKCGLPRSKAYEYASQMLLGASKLLLESGKSPGELKDAVCSPGGSTIAGVTALENGKFRATVIDAVCSAYSRTKELGKK